MDGRIYLLSFTKHVERPIKVASPSLVRVYVPFPFRETCVYLVFSFLSLRTRIVLVRCTEHSGRMSTRHIGWREQTIGVDHCSGTKTGTGTGTESSGNERAKLERRITEDNWNQKLEPRLKLEPRNWNLARNWNPALYIRAAHLYSLHRSPPSSTAMPLPYFRHSRPRLSCINAGDQAALTPSYSS